ncbi:MAG: sigma-54 dependent transcriptional regulator [Planctomycetaceae bacterium]
MRSLSRLPLVLIVDDDPDFQDFADWLFGRLGYEVRLAAHPSVIPHVMGGRLPDVVLLDWQLGEIDGTTLIEKLKRQFPLATIVFATGHSSPEVAAAAIKLGAFDFLVKPLDEAKLTVTLAKAVEHHDLLVRLHQLEEEVSGAETGFEGLIGVSPQMRTIYSIIRNVSPTNVNVLICGESGTGKELVASAIHARSDRSARPFVPLNMASIPGELAEATLFGHEKGAFTGADRDRLGAVGEAIGGTLFLDEITEMPLGLQGKLLRFLQERTYRPVGGRMDLKADIRIVSATNRDPLQAVRDKAMREDLYYRLNVVPIVLPPLREREGDVSLLAHHFLTRFSQQFRKSFTGIDREALQYMEAYPWPGNVRELVHTIQRIVVLNNGEKVGTHVLPMDLVRGRGTQAEEVSPSSEVVETQRPMAVIHASRCEVVNEPPPVTDSFPFADCDSIMPMEELERRSITRAISLCGSAQLAAHRLGISPATIYRKIKLYGLESR